MPIHIDSDEVLQHLNNYGIRSVDDDAFKLFIKDLKKLIKFEQQNMNSSSYNCKSNSVPEYCDGKMSNTINYSQSIPKPHKTNAIKENHCSQFKNHFEKINPKEICCCRCTDVIPSKQEVNCKFCLNKKDNIRSNSRNTTQIVSTTNSLKSINKSRCNCKLSNEQQCFVSEKCDIDKENTHRSPSSMSCAQSHANCKGKKLGCDPVGLYQYYQSIWKRHKLPGENDHAQLRRAIRNRLMKVK
ncbi:hypothetical protein PGB90_010020 [Kerria lacca]